MAQQTIVIRGVDVAELEQQRKALISVPRDGLPQDQWDALEGIQNMLDSWSDERAGFPLPESVRAAIAPGEACPVCGMDYQSLDMAELDAHDEHVVLRNEDAAELVELIARMTLEGECPECGYRSDFPAAGFESTPQDEAGNECPSCNEGMLFVMTAEDIAMTLNELIASARKIVVPAEVDAK